MSQNAGEKGHKHDDPDEPPHLRPFRGVNKEQLPHDAAVYEWASNFKSVADDFPRTIMMPFTSKPT